MKKIIYVISIFALSLTLSSCSSESEVSFLELSDELGFTGSTHDIQEFLTPEVYNVMTDLGLNINPGENPENVTGTFRASPYCKIAETNLPPETNCTFADFYLEFSNQDNESLTINYHGYQMDSNGNRIFEESGLGYISGDSSGNFTVIIKASDSQGNENATAFSGSIRSGGVSNYQDIFVPYINSSNLVGALFADGDGLAQRQ